jgi:hypothetical protein
VSLDDQRKRPNQREQSPLRAFRDHALIHRITSRIRRTLAVLRFVDLDSTTNWPDSVTVVERDEFGPLVIAIADAIVFPNGSVTADGRWLVSARFGIGKHRDEATEVIDVGTPCAFVLSVRPTRLNIVRSIGPSLATLGRFSPGVAVVVPDLSEKPHHPIKTLANACGVTLAGFAITRGAARRTGSAMFSRLPSPTNADGQVTRFAETLRGDATATPTSVYLEYNNLRGPLGDDSIVDVRFDHESAGARLLAVNRLSVDAIARSVSGASSVFVESPELLPFSEFAQPTASVTIVDKAIRAPRDPSRVTVTGSFDMDEALRDGLALPRGVEVISRPDYTVDDTTLDAHRFFRNGAWRRQDPSVLRERSLGPWLISVTNAIVAPNGSVLLEDGTLLAGTYFGGPQNVIPINGWITDERSGRAGLAITMSRAFGNGLMQVAPRIDAVNRFDPTTTFLVSHVPWNDIAQMNALGVAPERIVRVHQEQLQHLVRVPELIVSTQLQPESRTARADPRWMSEFVARLSPESAHTPGRRVYLARQDSSGLRGGCANRFELDLIAADFGYEKVVPELLTFDEQLRLATSTVDMFGEQGSALTWSMFMPPESRLVTVQSKPDDLQNRYVTFLNPTLAARRSRFFDVGTVRAGGHLSFEVDPRALRTAMEQLP